MSYLGGGVTCFVLVATVEEKEEKIFSKKLLGSSDTAFNRTRVDLDTGAGTAVEMCRNIPRDVGVANTGATGKASIVVTEEQIDMMAIITTPPNMVVAVAVGAVVVVDGVCDRRVGTV